MAAIPIQPMVPLDMQGRSMNPIVFVPYDPTSSNSPQRGDLFIHSGGRIREGSTFAATATAVGVSNVSYATEPATDDILPVVLALPGWLWEISVETSGSLAGTAITGTNAWSGVRNGSAPLCCTVDIAGGAAELFSGVSAAVNHSLYQTGAFIGQNASSPTAGSTMRPDARKGIPGTDTQIRVIAMFQYAATIWSA